MSGAAASDTAASTAESAPTVTCLEGLYSKLKDSGCDAEKVDGFAALLQDCSIGTMGALRAFHESVELCMARLYDLSDPFQELQAKGLTAAIRVTHTLLNI